MREIELEVEAKGREWRRQRLEEKLQREANRENAVFPLSQRKARHRRRNVLPLRTGVGMVKVVTWYGQDPATGRWGYPIRQTWGLRGWPIGSGAVESACSGHQNRFKRRGQFWTHKGLGNLAALEQARENKHGDELWFAE